MTSTEPHAGLLAGLGREVTRSAWLLRPRHLALRNRARRLGPRGKAGIAALAGLTLAFWACVFALFYRVLGYLLRFEEFGPTLTFKLLGMILIGFFSVLAFSNLISSLSTFYLSSDLDRLRAAPVSDVSFFTARLTETLVESSWMIVMFAVPAFLAFGITHGAGPGYYFLTAVTLPPFLLIPSSAGVLVATLLVSILPARRTRDVLFLLGVIAAAALYLVVRLLQPERLLNPEGAGDFARFLADLRSPASSLLPTSWAAEVIHPRSGNSALDILYYWALLATTAVLLTLVCEAVVRRLHLHGWSKAQEGRRPNGSAMARWERVVRRLLRPLDGATQLLVLKEMKVFARDSSQWSQLILLLSLAVVYVYNFSILPLAGGPLVTFYFRNAIAFMNLALAAFVTASVAVRFVFPSISLEGRAFWIVKTAPLDLGRLWWAKFWIAWIPLLVLGEVLVLTTNRYLGVLSLVQWLSGATMFGLSFAMVALGLWIGAEYPRFTAENAAKISAGAGGILYMILCMSLIGAVVLLEAWPVYAIFTYRLEGGGMPGTVQLGIAASLTAAAALCVGTFVISSRMGIDRLRWLEP